MVKNKPTNISVMSFEAMRSFAEQAVNIILPPQPLFRPQRGETRENAAQNWSDVRFLDEPCCVSCGFPFDFGTPALSDDTPATCGRCAAKAPAYDRARAAFAYDDASRSLVLRFKHGGETEGVTMFARQMRRSGRRLLVDADMLIPVPLHRRRLLKRRFNQSALLARALAKETGLPLETNSLLRTRHTPSQGGQSFVGRKRNVSGAFHITNTGLISDKRIVLIDDVMTTGATLESCARTLKRAGAKSVDAIVLSRVVKAATVPT